MKATTKSIEERLFVCVMAGGISYTDRTVEEHGDYRLLAFIPFSTGVLEWRAKLLDEPMREAIKVDAKKYAPGTVVRTDAFGHTVTMGKGTAL